MRRLFLSATLALASCSWQPAAAQDCLPIEDAQSILEEQYKEKRVFLGVGELKEVVILWLNPDTGTWTLTYSPITGVLCRVTSGEEGILFPPPPNL